MGAKINGIPKPIIAPINVIKMSFNLFNLIAIPIEVLKKNINNKMTDERIIIVLNTHPMPTDPTRKFNI